MLTFPFAKNLINPVCNHCGVSLNKEKTAYVISLPFKSDHVTFCGTCLLDIFKDLVDFLFKESK